jgi:hypothetical protein
MQKSTLLLLAAATLAAAPTRAKDEGCDVTGVARVVAIGDVHGAYPEFVAVLKLAGLIDDKEHWSGGRTHLVQTGDLLDRGAETRPVMELLMRLEGEAQKAGGRVHSLLGNHEVMNLLGDLRYVSRAEYKAFQGPNSMELRNHYYRSRRAAALAAAKAAGQPFDEAAFRAQFDEQVPLGFVERFQAFTADGRYGRWLRDKRAVVRIDGVAFLHGGLTPEVAALGCEEINERIHREITKDVDKTRENPTAALATSETGPLWYRGLAQEDETSHLPEVEKVLAGIGAHAVVIGHTVTGDGRITPRFGGRVVMIDVGMNPVYGRHLAALEVDPQGMAALYEGGREALELPRAAALVPY